ncbi:hypothetical protein POTOM_019212 [Populus tomentosa]|uniref:Uncharacterized protein n=1 Tax=Populus tomentosa TaxID=118781 RepID=A0A8X7ZWR9_POPTO|nr:hypothetical protein POTOM_019212 [Populus tomentosa]
MLRIASSHSCIIVLQKGQRLGFPYSFKSQLCAPGNFCFCTISRVGRCIVIQRVLSYWLHVNKPSKTLDFFESLGIDAHADQPLKQQLSIESTVF